tara:strand:+ start:2910 stop:3200 length:291 start_codon:yes stop_codon:yes gene_type:complete
MNTDEFKISVGNLGVKTTDYRGHTVEEVAEMATDRLISISDTANDSIKAQAHIFKDAARQVITHYMREAIKNHTCTVCNQLEQQGHKDLANIIRRL